ncbi:MAG: FapA family protein [Lachnospiraceae bacterium]|nr:FapA family protein [Lachnospiraceae bacterium]
MTVKEKETFLLQGFTEAQIEEIDLGMNAGIPVEIYANKSLMSQQMYQIRLGLMHNVDMSLYARPEYEWFQLEEIRLGLEAGLDVSLYDDNKMDSKKMHQMRRGLEHGIDMSDYLKYEPFVMRAVRRALINHVDLTTYVEQGYEADQLEAIREALEENVDIPQYLNIEFYGPAIREITEGIKENLDVEEYAKTCYCWAQMREIRLGLLSQVDVSYYKSPLYDRYQMAEIRLGLESGLEVDEYTSLMYPAREMQKIREELELGTALSASMSDEEREEANRDGVLVKISPDKMTAFIKVDRDVFGVVTRKDILRTLRLAGVTQNIDPRMLDNLLQGKHLGELVQIAAGKPPIDGEDGYYEYFFDTKKVRVPKMNPDGSVDYQNVDWYEEVKKGQRLAYYHASGKGEPGHNVVGDRIPSRRGKEMKALRGKGILISADKKTYTADIDGKIDFDGKQILNISPVLTLKDVNPATTGNVKFEGNVIIEGNVSNGVTITAGGDVVISGFVENSNIMAMGDVVFKQGVNGGGRGSVNAGGSVEGKFFESVNVKAGKNIQANYCLNSNIYSEGTINIVGTRGLLLGGTAFSATEINVSNVGNNLGVRTYIKLGVSDAMRDEQKRIESSLVDLNNKLAVLLKGQSDFQAKYPAEIRNAMEMYIKIENAIYTVNKDKEELNEEKAKILEQIASTGDALINVTGTLFDNIIIEIDGKRTISTLSSNVTIKKVDERVCIYKNNN